ncbi:hypothetical protein R3W88_019249 [Solanum pinnatisectum]|uniref:ferredoxin--NADP(+) reductase n=1 Tax=Solanum pinnatisectum TaxID=50273 RepID=A0AAV9KJS9_9SOLN|nr:hypothetical protein R3W88_019249 [Solanum pinnatisectum]
MAHSAISQMSVAVPLQTDSSFRRSTFKATNLTFSDKSCISMQSIDLKAARSRCQYIVCMSVQQASKAKGENPKKPGSPHNIHLYSIASTRYGDSFDGKTASLCVRRAVYYDPETGKEDPSKNGVCSNFLCNLLPGDKVKITGPSGKMMLLPEDNLNATHIMIGTGTGLAPFRGYLRRMFMESVPIKFNGLAWLFLGVANTDSLLYDDEFTKYLSDYPGNFRYDRALSREQKNNKGGKMYVQDKIEEYSDEIFKLLDEGAHIYFCGLKGMMPGIQDTLKRVAEERGES